MSVPRFASLEVRVYGCDYSTVYLDGWTYAPGSRASLECPGDPAEITLSRAWTDEDEHPRNADGRAELLELHFDAIVEAISEYERGANDDAAYDADRDDRGWG